MLRKKLLLEFLLPKLVFPPQLVPTTSSFGTPYYNSVSYDTILSSRCPPKVCSTSTSFKGEIPVKDLVINTLNKRYFSITRTYIVRYMIEFNRTYVSGVFPGSYLVRM